jgi:hypothetical protein
LLRGERVPLPGVDGSKVKLGDVFDDLDQFVELVALPARKGDEFLRSLDDGASFGCACDGDASSAPELEQTFIAELAERARRTLDRVRTHGGHRPDHDPCAPACPPAGAVATST